MIFLILMLSATLLAQDALCPASYNEAMELIKNYNYSQAEKKLEETTNSCSFEKYSFIYHQLALTYLWREKFDLAKPIIEKITKEAEYQQSLNPSLYTLGKGRILNIIYANYTGNTKDIEKEIKEFSDLNFKSQESLLFYLLRKNDKRFLNYFSIRKESKGDITPILCQVYCKKNSIIKDCPCNAKVDKKIEGGVYAIFQSYLSGEDLNSLKEKIEKNYKEAPGLKKEILEILSIK